MENLVSEKYFVFVTNNVLWKIKLYIKLLSLQLFIMDIFMKGRSHTKLCISSNWQEQIMLHATKVIHKTRAELQANF
jgi:hypothetical protein